MNITVHEATAAERSSDEPDHALFRALADGIPQLAWVTDMDGRVCWYNRRWHDYTGKSKQELDAQGWSSLLRQEDATVLAEKLARRPEAGQGWAETLTVRRHDGECCWFRLTVEPVLDSRGTALGWFGIYLDVTEQRNVEEQARADAERIRLAHAAGAIIGTWLWDLPTDRFTIDEPFAEAFGIAHWQPGHTLSLAQVIETVHPEDKPGLEAAIADVIARGGRYAHQYRVLRADGGYHWIEANGRVNHGPDGVPTSFPGVLLDVEASRAAAEALRDTSRRLNAILDNTQMAVFLMDGQQHCTYANAAAERLTGYTAAQMRGRPLHDVVHHKKPDGSHYPIEECPIDRAFPARAQMQGEELFVAPDGSFYPVAFTASPILDDAGLPIGTVIEARNIAADRARETALRESEARQRSILNALPQMVWTTRPDGYHEFFNERWYEFTGIAPGSTDGQSWAAVLHVDDQQRAMTHWNHCLVSGERYEIEYRLRHHDGVYKWTLARALPVRDEAGAILRWIGTCTDIDDMKRTGDELMRTSTLLRLISDSTPDLIYAKDLESRMLYANAAVQRAVGKPLEQIVGFTELDFAADREQALAVMANDRFVAQTGQTLDTDETYTTQDGQIRHYRSVKAPLRDTQGAVVGIVGVTSDVTQRREAEERERLLAREVDHRAKNMLAVVQALVNLTRSQDPAAFKKAVAGRIQSLARAHDLLVKSRWDGVNLRELVDQELAAFISKDRLAQRTGPALLLPPTVAQSLSLVLHELATNAAKYGALSVPQGRLALGWELETVAGRPWLRLIWCETGGPSVTAPGSTGFGSALIRSSVERQLEGRLRLDWKPAGLLCEIALPADKFIAAEEGAGAVAAENGQPVAELPEIRGKRVLIVEDEALISLEIEAMLCGAGCEVIGPVSSVEEGKRLLAETSVDAALLDVNLGGREFSYALADALAARGVPFAFGTGYAGVSELPPRFADIAVLAKPISRSALLAVVARLVGAKQS